MNGIKQTYSFSFCHSTRCVSDPAVLLCAASVHSSSLQPASFLAYVDALPLGLQESVPGGVQSPRSLNQPGAPGLPRAGLRLSCFQMALLCGDSKDKGQCAPSCLRRASRGAHWRPEGSQQRLTPASAQTPGKGSDPWLPCHLRKPTGHWKQTINPGTSQMRSRWLPGTRFLNIPPS